MRGTSYRHADCCVHLHVISVKCWCIDLRLGKGRSGFSLFSSPDNVFILEARSYHNEVEAYYKTV